MVQMETTVALIRVTVVKMAIILWMYAVSETYKICWCGTRKSEKNLECFGLGVQTLGQ